GDSPCHTARPVGMKLTKRCAQIKGNQKEDKQPAPVDIDLDAEDSANPKSTPHLKLLLIVTPTTEERVLDYLPLVKNVFTSGTLRQAHRVE
ncbi:MAG TPA: hypothetical protein VMT34_10205, partial [Aggregatilineales bacterium]|nr:hypothetical protein [Aggregatilineales bacterium]